MGLVWLSVFHKNFLVHDETEECVLGDIVKITATKKFSKRKNFILAKIVTPASRYTDSESGVTYSQVTDKKRGQTLKSKVLTIPEQMKLYNKE